MELRIKGTRYEPTAEILAQVGKQIEPLGRFLGADYTEALGELELERAVGSKGKGDIWRAELTITHEGRQFRAESTKAKLSHAITTVARDMKRELTRARTKDTDLLKKGGAAVKGLLRGFKGK